MIVGIDMRGRAFEEIEVTGVEEDTEEFWEIVDEYLQENYPNPDEYIISIKQPEGWYKRITF